jgi:murein DD-endopeptidase MepM/ murein hydrolase activator NlpD
LKGISSKEQDRIEIPKTILDSPGSSLKVRRSVAVLGLALSVGTTGVLINQQNSKDLRVTPIAQSPQTLADVLSQNKDRKYEMARAAIASGSWDNHKGVLVHEVREDETLFKLTQLYRIDAAAIATSNGISAATPLQPGAKLLIPPVPGIVYKVKPGDTLEAISKFYSVPKSDIVKYTSLKSSELLAVEQPIVIPGNVATLIKVREEDAKQRLTAKRDLLRQRLDAALEGKEVLVSHSASAVKKQPKFTLYKVKSGDTIEKIARKYSTSQRLIAQHNKLSNLHWLELGRELKIPAGKDTSAMQTVAYNSQKPQKLVLSTPNRSELEVSIATNASKPEIRKPATDKLEPVKNEPGKTEVLAIKVNAATPMILPSTTLKSKTSISPVQQVPTQNLQPQAVLPSAWDGLMQLSGSNFAKTMPSIPLLEEVLNQNSAAVSTSLPVETEPGGKFATTLFPFSPDHLIEQNAVGADVAKVIPLAQPAQEPSAITSKLIAKAKATSTNSSFSLVKSSVAGRASSIDLPKLAVAPTIQSIQSFDIPDRITTKQTSSTNTSNSLVAQPAPEPSAQISKLAVTPTIQSFDVVEKTLAKQNSSASIAPRPEAEPSIKLPKVAVAPSVRSVDIVEQSISARSLPVESSSAQPASEPLIKLPKLDVALTTSPASSLALEQQNVGKGKPTELALLPESEARMTSLELRRLELEVQHLNDKVKQAEIEAAARKAEDARQAEIVRRAELKKAEAAKIAAVNIRPSNISERVNNGREAIANPGKASPLAPELPELVAKAYLPDSGYGVSTGMIWPAEGTLTSGFGWRWGRVHQGIDIAAPTGTPILAAASGTVDYAGWNDGGYGNMVDIRHDDGTITRYGHLSAIYVKTGQPINQAQVIAAMGSTGFSTGPHLHFEIRPGGGRAVDPMSFLASVKR